MERRKKGSGIVETLPCRQCGAETLIDPRRMTRGPEGWQLRCHECGTDFPVRYADPMRPAPDGPPLTPPASEKRRRWPIGRR